MGAGADVEIPKGYPAPIRGPDGRQFYIRIGPVRAAVSNLIPANGILEKR